MAVKYPTLVEQGFPAQYHVAKENNINGSKLKPPATLVVLITACCPV